MDAYEIKNLAIEFRKDFKKEYSEDNINVIYPYYPLEMNECKDQEKSCKGCGIYPKTEFYRRDATTYIKLKDKDLWLHEYKNGALVFDPIIKEDFYYRQPLVLFIDYKGDNMFTLYKHRGFGYPELQYMLYTEDSNKKINIDWVLNMNNASMFIHERIRWREFRWIEPQLDTKKTIYGKEAIRKINRKN